jgi:hypothetical protein
MSVAPAPSALSLAALTKLNKTVKPTVQQAGTIGREPLKVALNSPLRPIVIKAAKQVAAAVKDFKEAVAGGETPDPRLNISELISDLVVGGEPITPDDSRKVLDALKLSGLTEEVSGVGAGTAVRSNQILNLETLTTAAPDRRQQAKVEVYEVVAKLPEAPVSSPATTTTSPVEKPPAPRVAFAAPVSEEAQKIADEYVGYISSSFSQNITVDGAPKLAANLVFQSVKTFSDKVKKTDSTPAAIDATLVATGQALLDQGVARDDADAIMRGVNALVLAQEQEVVEAVLASPAAQVALIESAPSTEAEAKVAAEYATATLVDIEEVGFESTAPVKNPTVTEVKPILEALESAEVVGPVVSGTQEIPTVEALAEKLGADVASPEVRVDLETAVRGLESAKQLSVVTQELDALTTAQGKREKLYETHRPIVTEAQVKRDTLQVQLETKQAALATLDDASVSASADATAPREDLTAEIATLSEQVAALNEVLEKPFPETVKTLLTQAGETAQVDTLKAADREVSAIVHTVEAFTEADGLVVVPTAGAAGGGGAVEESAIPRAINALTETIGVLSPAVAAGTQALS